MPYLSHALRRYPGRRPRLAAVPRALTAFVLARDRGRLKSDLIRAVLGGLSRGELARLTHEFLDRSLAKAVRHRALSEIEWHRANGDLLVLLTASPDIYARAIGARLGFDDVICTELEWQGEQLTGALSSPNLRGAHKARCLDQLRAENSGARVVAYANAGSDLAHLTVADRGVLVNGSAWNRWRATRLGLTCANWS